MANELIGKIKVVKSILVEFKKRLSNFGNIDKSFKDSEIVLNLQIPDLNEDYQKAKSLNSEIIANGNDSIDDFKNYSEDNVFNAITTIYFKHSTNLHELLKMVSKSDRHDITFTEGTQATFSRININANSSHPPVDVGLCYLQGSVLNFDGSHDKWIDFMDSYISTVHENESLSDCAKLRILKSLLEGDALKVIKREFGSLQSKHYDEIWANDITIRKLLFTPIFKSYSSNHIMIKKPQLILNLFITRAMTGCMVCETWD